MTLKDIRRTSSLETSYLYNIFSDKGYAIKVSKGATIASSIIRSLSSRNCIFGSNDIVGLNC